MPLDRAGERSEGVEMTMTMTDVQKAAVALIDARRAHSTAEDAACNPEGLCAQGCEPCARAAEEGRRRPWGCVRSRAMGRAWNAYEDACGEFCRAVRRVHGTAEQFPFVGNAARFARERGEILPQDF